MYRSFLLFLQDSGQEIFIEAEARKDKMINFIDDYNSKYGEVIDFETDGICTLGNVNKWGVELRIYFNDITNIPDYWNDRKYRNTKYRANEFSYRLDDKRLVEYLFSNGYRIGYN